MATTVKKLAQDALALPLPERVFLAEELWQSIDKGISQLVPDEEHAAIEEACRRDQELSSGVVTRRLHKQVMGAARRAL